MLRMYDVKANFKNKYNYDLTCPFCNEDDETFSHVFRCDSGVICKVPLDSIICWNYHITKTCITWKILVNTYRDTKNIGDDAMKIIISIVCKFVDLGGGGGWGGKLSQTTMNYFVGTDNIDTAWGISMAVPLSCGDLAGFCGYVAWSCSILDGSLCGLLEPGAGYEPPFVKIWMGLEAGPNGTGGIMQGS